jgi:hypothetical protein
METLKKITVLFFLFLFGVAFMMVGFAIFGSSYLYLMAFGGVLYLVIRVIELAQENGKLKGEKQ